MKIMVIGGGGREHAIARALGRSAQLLAAPGNPGLAAHAHVEPSVAVDQVEALVELARRERVDLVIPGPEAALVAGVADALAAAGIACCGPSRAAARLEASKLYMRQVAERAGVASPRWAAADDEAELERLVAGWDGLPVIKADGLAAGKGVFLPDSQDECFAAGRDLLRGSLGDAGRVVVLEERLTGIEASLFYACDGRRAVPLPHARDHKRIFDGERGPNTGGMGAVSPNPAITEALARQVHEQIVDPVLATLAREGTPYRGFLFAGLMLTASGPKLLEFNVRLGDPEAEAILPRLAEGELARIAGGVARGDLGDEPPRVDPRPTCGVVVTAAGYPDTPRKGDVITVAPELETQDRWLDHAGTKRERDQLVTNGGRVAVVVARGQSDEAARTLAYEGLQYVKFEGMHYRHDIGA